MTAPWDVIGIDVSDNINIGEAFKNSGIDFTVSVQQGYLSEGRKANGYYYIVRDDTNTVLGSCRRRFKPIQNAVLEHLCAEMVRRNLARLDTVGIFGGGSRVWVLLRLVDASYSVSGGDFIDSYLLLMNGHDGKTSISAGILPFRISCSNMLPIIGKYTTKFRHTANSEDNFNVFIDNIIDGIDVISDSIDEMKCLIDVEMTLTSAIAYWKRCLGGKGQAKVIEMIKSYHVSDTLWSAYNAVNSYYNYNYGRSAENRLKGLFNGSKIKRCYDLILEYVT
jgi:hypothetical protein